MTEKDVTFSTLTNGSNVSSTTYTTEKPKETELILGEKYILYTNKKLGSGAFGEIFEGKSILTGEAVACKVENKKAKHPQLHYEARLLKALGITKRKHVHVLTHLAKGIPRVRWFGVEKDYNIMVMEKLGSSLEDLFQKSKLKFSLKTVLMLGIEMIRRIQFIHSKNFIHRDIKPDNFLIGLGKNCSTIYLIDFGLSKKYKSNEQHIVFKDSKQLTGTARYASIGNHLGFEQSRRDDLESLGYVLVYFMKNEVGLPWQGLKAKNKYDKYAKICQKKQETSLESLCEGLPDCFAKFITAARDLQFEEEPKYDDYVNYFTKIIKEKGYVNDGMFDWCTVSESKTTILIK